MSVPLFRVRLPGSGELKSLMHTYSWSPGLLLGRVTSSTKVLGNWPEEEFNEDGTQRKTNECNGKHLYFFFL